MIPVTRNWTWRSLFIIRLRDVPTTAGIYMPVLALFANPRLRKTSKALHDRHLVKATGIWFCHPSRCPQFVAVVYNCVNPKINRPRKTTEHRPNILEAYGYYIRKRSYFINVVKIRSDHPPKIAYGESGSVYGRTVGTVKLSKVVGK